MLTTHVCLRVHSTCHIAAEYLLMSHVESDVGLVETTEEVVEAEECVTTTSAGTVR